MSGTLFFYDNQDEILPLNEFKAKKKKLMVSIYYLFNYVQMYFMNLDLQLTELYLTRQFLKYKRLGSNDNQKDQYS